MLKADQTPTTKPAAKVEMLSFAAELAYALQYKAKSDNWNANDHYSTTFYSTASQDRAYDECRATASLADDCHDLVMEMEDAIYDATNANRAALENAGVHVVTENDPIPTGAALILQPHELIAIAAQVARGDAQRQVA